MVGAFLLHTKGRPKGLGRPEGGQVSNQMSLMNWFTVSCDRFTALSNCSAVTRV